MRSTLLSIAGINTRIQSSLGEERVYLTYLTCCPIGTAHHSSRKREAGTDTETTEELCLLASFGLLSYLS